MLSSVKKPKLYFERDVVRVIAMPFRNILLAFYTEGVVFSGKTVNFKESVSGYIEINVSGSRCSGRSYIYIRTNGGIHKQDVQLPIA